MQLTSIHCYLVHPAKGAETQPPLGGTAVKPAGRLYNMLSDIFSKSETDCSTEICFNRCDDGTQQNDCRDLILAYLRGPTVENGREIAQRLQEVTTQKSGLGLLFVMCGTNRSEDKMLLSRFPAHHGILAEERKNTLSVEFLEKVFMKSASTYKAATYRERDTPTAFWRGRAVDKQMNSPSDPVAQYWIRDFLASSLLTTPAAGTKRLAVALREAMRGELDSESKCQIGAAVTLAGSLNGQTTCVRDFCRRFGLSQEATEAVETAAKHDSLISQEFRFDVEEFRKHVTFLSVELDSGAILAGEASQFDRIFRQEEVDQATHRMRFVTEGRVTDRRLRVRK